MLHSFCPLDNLGHEMSIWRKSLTLYVEAQTVAMIFPLEPCGRYGTRTRLPKPLPGILENKEMNETLKR